MTTKRRDSNDGPFSAWLRNHGQLDSVIHGMYATDIDMTIYRYKPHVDGIGTRDVKLMMDVEVKTFGAFPRGNQIEALFFRHQLLRNVGTKCKEQRHRLVSTFLKRKVSVWNFGQYVLRMCDGDRPDCCSKIEWLRFAKYGDLVPFLTDEAGLVRILAFDIRPDNLRPLELRRHHKTQEVMEVDRTGLFPVLKRIIQTS